MNYLSTVMSRYLDSNSDVTGEASMIWQTVIENILDNPLVEMHIPSAQRAASDH
jgi:hypothetical protein